MATQKHIALILNANKYYDRGILSGIATYARSVGCWTVYYEDEPLTKMPDLRVWQGDGIIADLDDEDVTDAVAKVNIPVVGVGGGGGGAAKVNVPYVDTDDEQIGRLAADHLLERGFRRFAYCGLPRTRINPWSLRRQTAFVDRVTEAGCRCSVFCGRFRTARRWEMLLRGLTAWVKQLEPPIGLMACNDLRARHVLEACRQVKLRVPDDVAVIGVDNDEFVCDLAMPPISSVIQNTQAIGAEAARILDQMIKGHPPKDQWRFIPPIGVAARQSTDITVMDDTLVASAVRFIRDNVVRRIQVADVLEHVGASRTGLDQRFRRQIGRTIHSEINRVRLNLARELLRGTNLSQEVIAHRVGFVHAQYMSAVFRKQLGKSPGAIRRDGRES